MELIARWTQYQDSSMELPDSVTWTDGTPATVDDYKRHQFDTRTLEFDEFGRSELRIFPEIVATVSFDPLVMDWVVKGPGVVTAALDLHDPHAKDDEILSELYTFPIIYCATIVRTPALATSEFQPILV
jgi:hypothetical protein